MVLVFLKYAISWGFIKFFQTDLKSSVLYKPLISVLRYSFNIIFRPVDPNVLDEIQKSIKPPPTMNLVQERSIPLVVAVADAARNPRIRGKPSRLRDLQQPVPMEENPQEPSIIPQRYLFSHL